MLQGSDIVRSEDVLNRFRLGDLDAFESLFREHQRSVYGWILRIVRDTCRCRGPHGGDFLAHPSRSCPL